MMRERAERPMHRLRRLEAERENTLVRELFEQQLNELVPPPPTRSRPQLRLYVPDREENS
jgi:hypothetical protein